MASTAHNQILPSALGEPYPSVAICRNDGQEFPLRVVYERLCFGSADDAAVIAAITNDDENEVACLLASAIGKERGALTEDAVYVVSADGRNATKLGMARSPRERFFPLQSGSPDKLRIHALMWSMDSKANALERACFKAVDALDARLMGEWTSLTPEALTSLVVGTARQSRLSLADSAMWIRNRGRLREARRADLHELKYGLGSGLGYRRQEFGDRLAARGIN